MRAASSGVDPLERDTLADEEQFVGEDLAFVDEAGNSLLVELTTAPLTTLRLANGRIDSVGLGVVGEMHWLLPPTGPPGTRC